MHGLVNVMAIFQEALNSKISENSHSYLILADKLNVPYQNTRLQFDCQNHIFPILFILYLFIFILFYFIIISFLTIYLFIYFIPKILLLPWMRYESKLIPCRI